MESTLPNYIEYLYENRFNKKAPDDIRPLEEKDAEKTKKKDIEEN